MDAQRIDKWLWHARVVRTRTLAQGLVKAGHVRLDGVRVEAASQPVRRGNVLTIALERQVRVLAVLDFAEKRGGAPQAALLYEDRSPPPLPRDDGPRPGGPRPTKRDRRQIDRLRDG